MSHGHSGQELKVLNFFELQIRVLFAQVMAVGHLALHKALKNYVTGEIVDGMRVDLPGDHHISCRLVCESICFLLVFCVKSLEPCQVVK